MDLRRPLRCRNIAIPLLRRHRCHSRAVLLQLPRQRAPVQMYQCYVGYQVIEAEIKTVYKQV